MRDIAMTEKNPPPENVAQIARKGGIALWRQIADQIRRLGSSGALADKRLPSESELAARFGVNRHTVRSAIAHLAREGIVRSEQGRGTFFETRKRLSYPIAQRTRFTAGLEGQAEELRSTLVDEGVEPADEPVAVALGLALEAPVVRLDTLSLVDGRPLSRATSWFPQDRFARIAASFARTGSITAALAAHGISDYTRRSTTITARHADDTDLGFLELAPGAIVIVAEGVNVDLEGRPIQYSRTRFVADRIELRVDAK